MKNRTVAAFLALFGGAFGIHKFYLNKPGPGIMYLVLFFVFSRFFIPISLVLGIFDALRLFMMTDRDFDRKYNGGKSTRSGERRSTRRNGRHGTAPVSRNTRQRANPFKTSGIRKYKEYDLDEAIIDFQKGLEIEPDDVALHFNIACAYSLTEQKDLAFSHLSRAVELGFKDFEKIQTHDDLAFMRIQPEFDEYKAAGYRLGGAAQIEESTQATDQQDDRLLARLNKLKELREKGIISETDYNVETKKILRR